MDIAIGNVNVLTSGFNFVWDATTRDVAFDDTEAHAVMTSALEDEDGYWANARHGGGLGKLQELNVGTPAQAVASTLASLVELEQAQRISGVRATAAATQGNRPPLGVDLYWTTPGVTDPQQQSL